MANILVNALVGPNEMEIITDKYQWISLTVDGKSVERNKNGEFNKKIQLTQGTKVPFIAKVSSVEILNPNINFGINGINYDGYWLTIDYSYISSNTEVELSGSLEWRNGFIHDAKNKYTFSQGKLTGQFVRVS